MSVRQIVFSNDPMLHEASHRVRRIDEDVEALIEDMIETMRAVDGIGLAAVQIGVPERVIVIKVPAVAEEGEEAEEPPQPELYVLVNPEIVTASGHLVEGIEGCLSIPGWVGEVERHEAIVVRGLDREGRPVHVRAEGLLARVFQHEIDHCQGTLFIDHIDDPDKIWSVEEGREEEAEAGLEVLSG
ncbi:MAG: peptide deformylase [Anaerolineae bacterium]|jgi:peptide deformylase